MSALPGGPPVCRPVCHRSGGVSRRRSMQHHPVHTLRLFCAECPSLGYACTLQYYSRLAKAKKKKEKKSNASVLCISVRSPVLCFTFVAVCLPYLYTLYGGLSRQAHVGTAPFGRRVDSHKARWPQSSQVVTCQWRQQWLLHGHASGIKRGVRRWKACSDHPIVGGGGEWGAGVEDLGAHVLLSFPHASSP